MDDGDGIFFFTVSIKLQYFGLYNSGNSLFNSLKLKNDRLHPSSLITQALRVKSSSSIESIQENMSMSKLNWKKWEKRMTCTWQRLNERVITGTSRVTLKCNLPGKTWHKIICQIHKKNKFIWFSILIDFCCLDFFP